MPCVLLKVMTGNTDVLTQYKKKRLRTGECHTKNVMYDNVKLPYSARN